MKKKGTNIITVGGSKYFLLPADILKDSNYPFKDTDKLELRIFQNRLLFICKKGYK